MRRVPGALMVVGAAGVLAAAGSASSSPAELYKALRVNAYPDSTLPAAFPSATIGTTAVGSSARAHGAIGAVEVDTDGPDPKEGVVFVVFRTAAGAAGDLAAALPSIPGLQFRSTGKVPGAAASALYTGSATTVDALNDQTSQTLTYAVVVQGNVLVAGFTATTYAHIGNAAGAVALARSGLAHLRVAGG